MGVLLSSPQLKNGQKDVHSSRRPGVPTWRERFEKGTLNQQHCFSLAEPYIQLSVSAALAGLNIASGQCCSKISPTVESNSEIRQPSTLTWHAEPSIHGFDSLDKLLRDLNAHHNVPEQVARHTFISLNVSV